MNTIEKKRKRKNSKKAAELFRRSRWLVDVICRYKKISFEEINMEWKISRLNDDKEDIPLRTFHEHKKAVKVILDIDIKCEKDGFKYYIENPDDMMKDAVGDWMQYALLSKNQKCETEIKKPRKSNKTSTERLFLRYAWLVAVIYSYRNDDGISFSEIKQKWGDSILNDDEDDIPSSTFNEHKKAVNAMFEIDIICNKRNGNKYYIEYPEDMMKDKVRNWMLYALFSKNLKCENAKMDM